MGRERFSGTTEAENPTANLAEGPNQEGGHDFAIVGGMIVDPWAHDYFGTPAIIPLTDLKTIRELYGDPACWTKLHKEGLRTAR